MKTYISQTFSITPGELHKAWIYARKHRVSLSVLIRESLAYYMSRENPGEKN